LETLNKNWFAFTLIAVIFGLLDFILVKQGAGSHYQSCPAMPMMLMKHLDGVDMKDMDLAINKEPGKNGEKKIKVKFIKKEK
jgi:hypothetical protein|tara:strand:- start:2243 stop:2488 length:246 start_codon:yes stop_codon:yes gene_type:complete